MENNEATINLGDILRLIRDKIKFILVVTILGAIIAFAISSFVLSKQYTSSALLYVDARNASSETNTALNYNDITASEKLVNTCQILFTSDKMLDYVISDLDAQGYTGLTKSEIAEYITVASQDQTSTLNVSVTTTDPKLSASIANIVKDRADTVYQSVVDSGFVKQVTEATVPTSPSSPNVKLITLLGFMAGLVISVLFVIIRDQVDTKIKPQDNLFEMYNVPVFAEINDFDSSAKGGYNYYEYKQ